MFMEFYGCLMTFNDRYLWMVPDVYGSVAKIRLIIPMTGGLINGSTPLLVTGLQGQPAQDSRTFVAGRTWLQLAWTIACTKTGTAKQPASQSIRSFPRWRHSGNTERWHIGFYNVHNQKIRRCWVNWEVQFQALAVWACDKICASAAAGIVDWVNPAACNQLLLLLLLLIWKMWFLES